MKRIVVGIVAHVDAGKTTLAESILYLSGSIRRRGNVDEGDTALDTNEIEKERGITIFAGEAHFTWKNTDATLLDTPGHVDFSAETERIIRVLDLAILVISGIDGIESHTRTLMSLLEKYCIPTIIFITKNDYGRLGEKELIRDLNNEFGQCIRYDYNEGFSNINDDIALLSDNAMEEYISLGCVSDKTIISLIKNRDMFPCVFGSGLKCQGVDTLLDVIDRYSPHKENSDVFGAKAFKISNIGNEKFTHIKITSGRLKVRDTVFINSKEAKITSIRVYNGTKYEAVNEVVQGQVCRVTGLSETIIGTGIGCEKDDEKPILEPVMRYRIKLSDSYDSKSIYNRIKILNEEEPLLHLSWDESLSEIYVDIMGAVQTQILVELLFRRFGIKCEIDSGRVLYKETIDNISIGVGHFEPLRHYAEVHLRLEPLPRGHGLVFGTECSVNNLSLNWQRLVISNLSEKTHLGVLTGSPITDMKITLVSGKDHIKHTEGGDFRQSTYRAVRQGLMKAKSRLLEPYYSYKIDVLPEQIGKVISDIRKMYGTYQEPEYITNRLVRISGRIPVSTVNGYAESIASYTSGRGRLSLVFDGYGDCHNSEEIIKLFAYNPESDIENTPDSVFCNHGSSCIVKWNNVEKCMHIK